MSTSAWAMVVATRTDSLPTMRVLQSARSDGTGREGGPSAPSSGCAATTCHHRRGRLPSAGAGAANLVFLSQGTRTHRP